MLALTNPNMKQVYRTIISTLAFTILVSCAFSQGVYREGFITKGKQDTVRGFIKMIGDVQDPRFRFKSTPESKEQDILPGETETIVIKDHYYFTSIPLEPGPKFAQTLVDGEVDLYMRDKQFYLQKEGKLSLLNVENVEMKKADNSTGMHVKKVYIGTLKSAMSDCPKIWPEIDKSRLVENDLTNLVRDYNKCREKTALVFKENIPSFKLTISPFVAWSYSKINATIEDQFRGSLGYFEEADLSNFSISPGLGFTLSNPRLNDRIAFYTELRYISNTFQDRVIYPTATYDDNDITIKSSYIYIPITVKYDMPLNLSSALYIKGGLLKTFLLSSSFVNVRQVSSVPSSPPLVVEDPYEFKSSQTGFTLSLGYQMKPVNKKIGAWAELRFDGTGPVTNDSDIGLSQQVLSLVTAISF